MPVSKCFAAVSLRCCSSICRIWITTCSDLDRIIRRIAEDIRLVDREAGKLIDAARDADADVVVLSEYGITEVNQPIHINRALRMQDICRYAWNLWAGRLSIAERPERSLWPIIRWLMST